MDQGNEKKNAHGTTTRLAVLAAALAFAAAAAAGEPYAAQAVARDVYVFPGATGEADARNEGRISNIGAIVGERGVVLIGTGASSAQAGRLLEAVAKLSDRPVVLAINTQATPDHVLGNAVFAERGIAVLAHRETHRFMAQNCANCLKDLAAAVGEAPMAGTRSALPTRLVEGSETLEAGGRALEILHFGATFQAGSIAVLDRASGVLFAGELVSLEQLPDVRNAQLGSWLRALDALGRLPLRSVVPAHGPVAAPARLGELAGYLRSLAADVAQAYARGDTLDGAARGLAVPPAYRGWALHETQHGRNVFHEYLRIETRDLAGAVAPARQ